MIYFHNEDGEVTTTYSESSGIKYILEYECDRKYSGSATTKIPTKMLQVACPDKAYAQEWISRNEIIEPVYSNSPLRYTTPILCVIGNDGNEYCYWKREFIEINRHKEYHFYENKSYSID